MDYKADIGQVQHRSTEPVYCAYPTQRHATEMLGALPEQPRFPTVAAGME